MMTAVRRRVVPIRAPRGAQEPAWAVFHAASPEAEFYQGPAGVRARQALDDIAKLLNTAKAR